MNQENKELLLKDLCSRMPYEVKVNINPEYLSEGLIKAGYNKPLVVYGITADGSISFTLDKCLMEYSMPILSIKPYLFPLSSMTEEQTKEVHSLIYQGISESVDETKEWLKTRKENELRPITLTYILSYALVIDWFCKNHFDYRGLIPKGLAIDATGLNIY